MSQAEIMKLLQEKISSTLRVAMPGIIEKYDFAEQKADIKIDMQELYADGSELDYPVITGVPIIFPKSGGASITMPVVRGDTCLIMFLDRDITDWLLGASRKKAGSRRMHHLSDAVALLGLSPFTSKSAANNNADLLINYDGSSITLKPKGEIDIITANNINIKSTAININCSGNITVKCESATVNANTSISTTSPTFTQNGDFKITGNVVINGTTEIGDALTTKNGITNSGANLVSNGIILESHTHTYNDVTTVIAPSGGGPCSVTKTPSQTQKAS